MELLEVVGERGVGAGRRMMTRRRLEAGDLVLSETALVWGPRLSQSLVCVSCLARLTSLQLCPSCGLPLCSLCQSGAGTEPSHQHFTECQIFVINNVHFTFKSPSQAKIISPIVTIIRLLLSRKDWKHLESNIEARKGTKSWNYVEKHIVPVLTPLKDINGNNIFTKENIHLAAGVLDTNCFEIKSKEKFGRSLFLTGAMLNNSCSPNCVRRVTRENIEIISVRSVEAGEELSICYTDVLLPTTARQEIFQTSKHFWCLCHRCRSSSQWDKLRCQCCGSLVTDENCEDCGSYFSSEDQRRLELESQEVLAATSSSDCSSVLEAVSSLSSRLGDGHQLLLQAQTAVLQHVSTCRACSDNQLTLGVLSEIARARLSILATSLDLPSCYR